MTPPFYNPPATGGSGGGAPAVLPVKGLWAPGTAYSLGDFVIGGGYSDTWLEDEDTTIYSDGVVYQAVKAVPALENEPESFPYNNLVSDTFTGGRYWQVVASASDMANILGVRIETLLEQGVLPLIASKADQSALDALSGGPSFEGAYDATKSYAKDSLVSYDGAIWRAKDAVGTTPPLSFVGRNYAKGPIGSISLPAGAQVGDMAVLVGNINAGTVVAAPAGWTALPGFPLGSVAAIRLYAWSRTITSADIDAGAVPAMNAQDVANELRVYRGAAVPTVPNTPPTSATVGVSATTAVTPWAPPSDSFVLRIAAYAYNNYGMTAAPTVSATGTADTNTWLNLNQYHAGLATHLTRRPLQTGDGSFTSPTGSGTSAYMNTADILIVPSSGFSPTQWDKVVGSVKPFSTSSAYAAGDLAAYGGDIYQATTDVSALSGISFIGRTSQAFASTTNPTFTLPAGAAAGDVVVVAMGTGQYSGFTAAAGSGWTKLNATANQGGVAAHALTAAEVAAGQVVAQVGYLGYGGVAEIRVYRGAAVPADGSATVTYGASPPALTVAADAVPVAVFAASRNNGTATSAGALTGAISTSSGGGLRQNSASDPQVVQVAHGPAGPSSLGSGHTTWGGLDISSGPNIVIFQFSLALAAGFNASQWTRIVKGAAPKRIAVANVNYTADGTEDVIEYTSLSTARIVTLPAASALTAGQLLVVKDGAANMLPGTRFIRVQRAGTDTVNGSTSDLVIEVNYGSVALASDGVSKWTILRDYALAGKLDNVAGAVGLANLADAAKPAVSAGQTLFQFPTSSTTITAGVTNVNAGFNTASQIRLPTSNAHGNALMLIRTSQGSGSGDPVAPLTVLLSGSDKFSVGGGTSIEIPASVGWTLLRANGNTNRWDVVAGAGAPNVARATATKTTASLATDALESGTIALAKSFRLLRVATDKPARVRLYATAAQRDADAARPVLTPIDPEVDHGLLLEFISAAGALTRVLTPQVDGSNLETAPTGAIPCTITNLDAATGTVTTTFTYIATEA